MINEMRGSEKKVHQKQPTKMNMPYHKLGVSI
jgi:hypothetical protein